MTTPHEKLGLALGFMGVLLFMLRRGNTHMIELGDLYLLGTIISGAFGYTLSGRLSRKLPGWEVISWQVALFLPLSLGAALMLWPVNLGDVTASHWAGLIYVSFISQFSVQCRHGNWWRRPRRAIESATA